MGKKEQTELKTSIRKKKVKIKVEFNDIENRKTAKEN